MADLFITDQGGYLRKQGGSLLLEKDDQLIFELGLRDIDSVQIFGNIQFSTQTLNALLKEGIEFVFYSSRGGFRGRLAPPQNKNIERRINQYRLAGQEAFRREFSRELVNWKFRGCLAWAREYDRKTGNIAAGEWEKLEALGESLTESIPTEKLLGLEGSFARAYYGLYGKLFREPDLFQGRKKHPPGDGVNALLSFRFTMLTREIASICEGLGLDPYLGFYHQMDYGRLSLAYDLVEVLRPWFGDYPVLRWFNLGMFPEDCFEAKDGGVYLTRDSLPKFLRECDKDNRQARGMGFFEGDLRETVKSLVRWTIACVKKGEVLPLATWAAGTGNETTPGQL